MPTLFDVYQQCPPLKGEGDEWTAQIEWVGQITAKDEAEAIRLASRSLVFLRARRGTLGRHPIVCDPQFPSAIYPKENYEPMRRMHEKHAA
jgi:hypothetical protein